MNTESPKTSKKMIDLESITLLRGPHTARNKGVCLLEAVAWFAGEKHSDAPECTDIALAAYGRAFNDRLRDDERQLLKPLIPRLVGTKGTPELAKRRAFLLVDRHVRVNLPAFFRELPRKPRPDLAARFEALDPVTDRPSAERARDLAREVRADLWKSLPAYAADAAAYAADAAADADADAAACADAAAYAAAYAADAAAAYAADAAAVSYDAYAAAAAAKELRKRTIERSIASFEAAIDLVETGGAA